MPHLISQKELFKKYNLNQEYYELARKHWPELRMIYNDYIETKLLLDMHIQLIVGPLISTIPQVHSIRYRLKEPEHLIEKIIRKEYLGNITVQDYRQKITDLIGVRVLHLFKADWMYIHRYIMDNWKRKEPPIANIREGDSKELTEIYRKAGCRIKKHKAGYRSIHYLVNTPAKKQQQVIEIQVRTIFEEGWSEIDHHFRYPYDANNVIIKSFIDILNRQAGSADEIGTLLKDLHANSKLDHRSQTKQVKKRSDTMESKIDEITHTGNDTKESDTSGPPTNRTNEIPELDPKRSFVSSGAILGANATNEMLALSQERMLSRQIEIIERSFQRKVK